MNHKYKKNELVLAKDYYTDNHFLLKQVCIMSTVIYRNKPCYELDNTVKNKFHQYYGSKERFFQIDHKSISEPCPQEYLIKIKPFFNIFKNVERFSFYVKFDFEDSFEDTDYFEEINIFSYIVKKLLRL